MRSRAKVLAGVSAVVVWTLLLVRAADAQEIVGPFRDFDWYEPLVAEQRAAQIAIAFGATDQFEFSLQPGQRFVWDIHLGRELPMIAFTTATNPDLFRAGEWGIGLWTPLSFHMIEDFKDASNPIVNTDYRFGSMVKFRY